MAKIINLLEIDLNGASFRLEFGGVVALAEKDAPVAVVQVDSFNEAERLETLASALHFTFRWKEGHDRASAISVRSFEAMVSSGIHARRFLSDEARARLGYVKLAPLEAPKGQATYGACGHPITLGYACDVCGPVDYNYPGKHD